MSKKLMLLAAGILSALAFTALPSVASAGTSTLHCAKLPCTGTVTGGVAKLSTTPGGKTVECTSITGNTTQPALTSTTGTAQLTFHECRERTSGFGFSCTGTGQPTRTIQTNVMTTDFVRLETVAPFTPGVLMTGVSVTFTCAGFQNFTVTGNVIGELEEASTKCGVATKTLKLSFVATSHGQQKWKKVTTAGTEFDLTSNNHAGGAYETAAQEGTGTITWPENVTLTC
jgi:hypothetical protein